MKRLVKISGNREERLLDELKKKINELSDGLLKTDGSYTSGNSVILKVSVNNEDDDFAVINKLLETKFVIEDAQAYLTNEIKKIGKNYLLGLVQVDNTSSKEVVFHIG